MCPSLSLLSPRGDSARQDVRTDVRVEVDKAREHDPTSRVDDRAAPTRGRRRRQRRCRRHRRETIIACVVIAHAAARPGLADLPDHAVDDLYVHVHERVQVRARGGGSEEERRRRRSRRRLSFLVSTLFSSTSSLSLSSAAAEASLLVLFVLALVLIVLQLKQAALGDKGVVEEEGARVREVEAGRLHSETAAAPPLS